MENENDCANEDYLDELKASLSAPSVIKAELADLRSGCPGIRIFALEGVTDTIVYSHWLAKYSPDFEYELFICRNKHKVLQLIDLLDRDLTELSKKIYFFIDRDFDDLRGREYSSLVYMTESYSIENSLVTMKVLDEVLKSELHCHGNRIVRTRIIDLFNTAYDNFLKASRNLNFRIFLARKLEIEQTDDLPTRLNQIAEVSLYQIKNKGESDNLVRLIREPNQQEVASLTNEFDELDPAERYRGKFATMFFLRWLTLLQTERNMKDSPLFNGLPQAEFDARANITFSLIASRSQPPTSFVAFLDRIVLSEQAIH